MICNKVSVENFRNATGSVTFCEGVNILLGNNAQGKTNLLEAVWLASSAKSFRATREEQLIRFGEDFAVLSVDFTDSRKQNITMKYQRGRRHSYEINKNKVTKLSDFVGRFRCVLFCPEHLSLIQGGPELRRSYLNVALSQLRPVYLQSLQRYNKLLKERNALLKRAPEDMATFKATEPMWSAQLAHEAALITVHRARYVRQVNDHVRACFADMMKKYEVGEELPELSYQPTLGSEWLDSHSDDSTLFTDPKKLEERYLELLTTRHDREIGAGATLWGVHKDDVRINLNGRPARLYASQGQQRSLALAMKLAEGWVSAYESGGDMPVFLFDDVLSELDTHRRNYLVQEMRGRQVIMTACDPASADFGEAVHLIHVDSGRYSQREV